MCVYTHILSFVPSGHIVGDSLTIADFLLAIQMSFVVSGWFDGVPTTTFSPFPEMCAVRKTVGGKISLNIYIYNI